MFLGVGRKLRTERTIGDQKKRSRRKWSKKLVS